MEFFEFMSIAQAIIGTGEIAVDTVQEAILAIYRRLWICLGVAAGVYLVTLVLGGIGLVRMAKRAGKKYYILAFLPFTNTWYAGYLAGEANFFGQRMKRAGLYSALVEGLYSVVEAFSLTSTLILFQYGHEVVLEYPNGTPYSVIEIDPSLIPDNLRWMYDASPWFEGIGLILSLVLIVFLCVTFLALFRKYYARSPMLMTFLCAILPFRAFVLFAVRNNTPVDYNAYMQQRMQEMARRQQSYYQQPPYGPQNGPQNGPQGGPQQPPREDPFDDFGSDEGGQNGNSENPFDDF